MPRFDTESDYSFAQDMNSQEAHAHEIIVCAGNSRNARTLSRSERRMFPDCGNRLALFTRTHLIKSPAEYLIHTIE